MSISRRIFMRTGTMFVLAAASQSKLSKAVFGQEPGGGMNGTRGFRVPEGSMRDPLTYYTKATFVARLNDQFRLGRRNSSWEVTLIKVVDFTPAQGKSALQGGNGECFSLVFSGAKRLPQDTYTIEHGSLETFRLLLVPSGKPGGVSQLEAVINRWHS